MTTPAESAAAPRGRGRPRVGTKIEVIIPDDLLADIEAAAARRDTDRSTEIRRRCGAFQEPA